MTRRRVDATLPAFFLLRLRRQQFSIHSSETIFKRARKKRKRFCKRNSNVIAKWLFYYCSLYSFLHPEPVNVLFVDVRPRNLFICLARKHEEIVSFVWLFIYFACISLLMIQVDVDWLLSAFHGAHRVTSRCINSLYSDFIQLCNRDMKAAQFMAFGCHLHTQKKGLLNGISALNNKSVAIFFYCFCCRGESPSRFESNVHS